MIFIFKKTTIHLDFFVDENSTYVAEYSPVLKASKLIPEWFKELQTLAPKKLLDDVSLIFNHAKNVKYCPGINTTLTSGFIVPLWCDLFFESEENNWSYQFSDKQSVLHMHSNSQMTGCFDDYHIAKIQVPWIGRSSKACAFISLPPIYHTSLDKPYREIHGFIETCSRYNILNVNSFLLFKKGSGKTIIPLHTPLSHMIPFGGEKVEIKCHVDTKEYNRLKSLERAPLKFTAISAAAHAIVRLSNKVKGG